MSSDNEKLLAIAHGALSMVDDNEWDKMFKDWLATASGTIEALVMFTRESAKKTSKKKRKSKDV